IAGHTMGHYLSAAAQAYEASGKTDTALRAKIDEAIGYLDEAQAKTDLTGLRDAYTGDMYSVKKGFLFVSLYDAEMWDKPVFGEQQFDNAMDGKTNLANQSWVPWYTMHKILQGLVDLYNVTGDATTRNIASELGTWAYNRVGGYTTAQQN